MATLSAVSPACSVTFSWWGQLAASLAPLLEFRVQRMEFRVQRMEFQV